MKTITIYKKGEIIFHQTNICRVILEKSGNLQVWQKFESVADEINTIKMFFNSREYDWFDVE